MPPGKSKEDTWKTQDLERHIRHKDEKRKGDKEGSDHRRKDRHRDEDDEKRMRRKKHEEDERKERRHRDDGHKERDRDKDKRSSHKDRDDEERRKKKDERRRKEEGDDERRHRRHRDDEGEERSQRRHRDRDDDRKKERRPKDDEGRKGKDERRHHRDDDEKRQHRSKDDRDGERRRKDGDRDDDKRRRHRDEDDRKQRKHKDEKEKDRHRDEKDRKQRNHDEDREKRHRDRDRERRHRERDDSTERGDKEKTRKEKDKKRKEEPREEETAVKLNGGGEDDYDDEEFEDYDDDFEDDDDDESSDKRSRRSEEDEEDEEDDDDEENEIVRAMNEENQRLFNRSKNRNEDEDDRPTKNRPTTAGAKSFINFVSAKQRNVNNQAAGRTRRRGAEILKLIELDSVQYEMFDMPPVSEYDMYMRSFGSSDTRQAYIQTNDDNIDREIQTDDIESSEKWCQHPQEDFCASGSPEDDEKQSEADTKPVDHARFSKFIQSSGRAMLILLEEESAQQQQQQQNQQQSAICVSEAYVEMNIPRFLKGRHVVYSQFSSSQSHMLITVFSSPREGKKNGVSSGVILIWNVNEPSWPYKVLITSSEPRCCCFSPDKANLVFAGMHDGSVAVWDLREPSAMHRTYQYKDDTWVLCHPTYDTAGVLQYDNHHSGVISICPIVAQADSTSTHVAGTGSDGDGMSFQLATVEESAVLHLWVVAEISKPDQAGSESDLGLAPGGRVKMLRSSTIQLENPLRDASLRTNMRACDMQLLPSNNSHFYIATDTGCVLHGVRYGGRVPPRAYRPEIEAATKVTSIDFSPFAEPVFLAGCQDGSLRLYSIHSEQPLQTWLTATDGVPIRMVRWARSRPSVFFVLDARSNMHIWDLTMADASPLKSEPISQQRVTSLCLSNDHKATSQGTPGRRPQMVVGMDSGHVEVHTISQKFSAMMDMEMKQFTEYLQNA